MLQTDTEIAAILKNITELLSKVNPTLKSSKALGKRPQSEVISPTKATTTESNKKETTVENKQQVSNNGDDNNDTSIKQPISVLLVSVVLKSSLFPLLVSYLSNDSILEMSDRKVLYSSIFELLQVFLSIPDLNGFVSMNVQPFADFYNTKYKKFLEGLSSKNPAAAKLAKRRLAYKKKKRAQNKIIFNNALAAASSSATSTSTSTSTLSSTAASTSTGESTEINSTMVTAETSTETTAAIATPITSIGLTADFKELSQKLKFKPRRSRTKQPKAVKEEGSGSTSDSASTSAPDSASTSTSNASEATSIVATSEVPVSTSSTASDDKKTQKKKAAKGKKKSPAEKVEKTEKTEKTEKIEKAEKAEDVEKTKKVSAEKDSKKQSANYSVIPGHEFKLYSLFNQSYTLASNSKSSSGSLLSFVKKLEDQSKFLLSAAQNKATPPTEADSTTVVDSSDIAGDSTDATDFVIPTYVMNICKSSPSNTLAAVVSLENNDNSNVSAAPSVTETPTSTSTSTSRICTIIIIPSL